MARVSLIPVVDPRSAWPTDRLASFRHELEAAGYSVDSDSIAEPPARSTAGLAEQAVEGIRNASGSTLVIVDPTLTYTPDHVLAVVDRLNSGSASLVVAVRRRRWIGPLARRLTGISDPTAGLVGLTRTVANDVAFAPVGSRFTIELLARVAGERAEVAVDRVSTPRRRWISLDDIRHTKRIADQRFGTLSRLMQFCFVGASGMVVDLTTYATLLAVLTKTPLHERSLLQVIGGNSVTAAQALAGMLAIATAIVWNFSMNRRLTFNDAHRGSIGHQFCRYLLSNLAGCAVSLAFRLLLPSRIPFFARHRLAAAVTGIVAATGISFSLARWFVFTNQATRVPSVTEPILDTVAR